MWILLFHLVLPFPRELWSTLGVPTDLKNKNLTTLWFLDLAVHDLDRFIDESKLFINLDFFQRYNKCFISQTLFEIGYMENIAYTAEFSR